MSQKEINPDFVDTEPILILLSTIHKNILGVNLRFFKTGFQKSTSCYCRFTFPLKQTVEKGMVRPPSHFFSILWWTVVPRCLSSYIKESTLYTVTSTDVRQCVMYTSMVCNVHLYSVTCNGNLHCVMYTGTLNTLIWNTITIIKHLIFTCMLYVRNAVIKLKQL